MRVLRERPGPQAGDAPWGAQVEQLGPGQSLSVPGDPSAIGLVWPTHGAVTYRVGGQPHRLSSDTALLFHGPIEVTADYSMARRTRLWSLSIDRDRSTLVDELLGPEYHLPLVRPVAPQLPLSLATAAWGDEGERPDHAFLERVTNDLIVLLERLEGRALQSKIPRLRRLMVAHHLLLTCCRGNLSVTEVAELSEMSRWMLHRDYTDAFEASPLQVMNRSRLRMACQYLRHTRLPVNDIAFQCGFGDRTALLRIFRQHLDLTPTQFRTNHQSRCTNQPNR